MATGCDNVLVTLPSRSLLFAVVIVSLATAGCRGGTALRSSTCGGILDGDWSGATGTDVHAATLTWSFDGRRYSMEGYPPIRDEGRVHLAGCEAATFDVTFTSRKTCGPCSPSEGLQAAPDRTVSASWVERGRVLKLDGLTLQRTPR